MSIRFKCAECGSSMKIKDELAGTQGKCPKCKTEFTVPEPDEKEPVEVAAATATVAAAEEKSEPEDPEDEYQRILMGDSPRESGSRKRPLDSDAFISSDSADDHPHAEPPSSETEIKSPPEPPKKKSAAEISAMLMKNSAEPTMKKSGKAFGDASGDRDSARKKLDAETRNYYAKQLTVIVAGTIVVCGGLYWLMSSMMGGIKYPPLGRVSGIVTLDGKPLPGASVKTIPMLEGMDAKSKGSGSGATSDSQGHYTLNYVQGVPGAVLGKHLIQVDAQSKDGLPLVPGKYNVNSELILEVKSGSNPYDIKLTSH